VAALIVTVLAVVGGRAWMDRRRTAGELEALREAVADARTRAEGCRSTLARQEDAFRRFDDRVDELEADARRYEALDERGVPRDLYREYLERVETYNDSVAAWQRWADGLRTAEESCRRAIRDHNGLADSLRARMEREGLTPEG
jgi:phage shock protein A